MSLVRLTMSGCVKRMDVDAQVLGQVAQYAREARCGGLRTVEQGDGVEIMLPYSDVERMRPLPLE